MPKIIPALYGAPAFDPGLPIAAPPRQSGRIGRRRLLRSSLIGLSVASMVGLSACASSPSVLSIPPAFAINTPTGVKSVSIREPLPGTTDEESIQLVKAGMERAAPGSVLSGPLEPPYPTQRIVWHVASTDDEGTSRLIVNVFDGSTAVAYEEDTVANTAPQGTLLATIQSMTTRLLARHRSAAS